MNLYQDSIKSMEFKSIDPATVMRSRSGVRFVQSNNKQAFEVVVNWVSLPNQDAAALNAALVGLRGQLTPISLAVPVLNRHANASGDWLTAAHNAGESQVNMGLWAGALTVGGVFNFDGASKLYMVTAQVNGVVSFTPPLRQAIGVNTRLIYSNPLLYCARKDDTFSFKMTRKNSTLKDTFEEVLT